MKRISLPATFGRDSLDRMPADPFLGKGPAPVAVVVRDKQGRLVLDVNETALEWFTMDARHYAGWLGRETTAATGDRSLRQSALRACAQLNVRPEE